MYKNFTGDFFAKNFSSEWSFEDIEFQPQTVSFIPQIQQLSFQVSQFMTDLPDNATTPITLATDESHTSDLSAVTDVDWIGVNFIAGRTYTIGVGFEAFSQLVDASGAFVPGVVGGIDPVTLENTIVYTALADVTHYISVFGGELDFSGLPITYPLNYTASVTSIVTPIDDYPDNATTSALIFDGETISGVLEENIDLDWIGVDLIAGQDYEIVADHQGFADLVDANGVRVNGILVDTDIPNEETILFVNPTVSGTYYYVVGDNGGIETFPHTYTVALNAVVPDLDNEVWTLGTLSVGGQASSRIEMFNDADWFAIELDASQMVNFSTDVSIYQLNLFDGSGAFVTSINQQYSPYTPPSTGLFFLEVVGLTRGVDYTVFANEVLPDVAGDISSTATISTGETVDGVIDSSPDNDFFGFAAQAGQRLRFTIDVDNQFIFNSLALTDSTGAVVTEGVEFREIFTNLSILEVLVPTNGAYFIDAALSNAGGELGTQYTLSSELIVDDFEADNSTLGALTVDGTASGVLDFIGDIDWFSFNATAGGIYEISFEAIAAGMNVEELDYSFRDANGNLLVDQINVYGASNPNGALILDVAQAGTYFLVVDGTAVNPLYTQYNIALDEIADDYTNDINTIGALEPGVESSGTVEYRLDGDWFSFTGTAGDHLTFDFVSNLSANNDVFLNIFDSSGNFVSTGVYAYNSGIQGSDLFFDVSVTDTYFIEVADRGGSPTDSAYSLLLTEVVDDFSTDATNAGTVLVNSTSAGRIDFAGDIDTFAVSLDAGVEYRFGTHFGEVTGGVIPNLVGLFDASGTSLGYSAVQPFIYTPDVSGTYYIAVIDRTTGVGPFGDYNVSVVSSQDDFANDVTTTGVVDVSGVPTIGAINFNAVGDDDEDAFAFVAAAGDTVQFNVDGVSLVDPVFAITDSAGTILAFNDDVEVGNARAELTYTFATAGTFYVLVGSAIFNDIGTYQITARLPLTGTTGSDTIIGTNAGEFIDGLGANDQLTGAGGNDVLDGGFGNDILNGGAGDDILDGGEGIDTVSYDGANGAVIVNFGPLGAQNTFGAGFDTLSNFENMIGSSFGDVLTGNTGANEINGGAGADILNGGAGDDVLIGGAQNDVLNGGVGNDTLLGGLGADTLNGDIGNDLLLGGNRNDTLDGGVGNDRVFGGNADDTVMGGRGDDILRGGDQNDMLDGGDGNDFLFGGTGIDNLSGGAGNDTLIGRGGFDVLNGGEGDDILSGGFNADVFVFEGAFGNDIITDFSATSDAEDIDLSGVASIVNFTDLLNNHATQVGSDVIIDDLLGNTITLQNVDISDLNVFDFIF